MAQQFLDTNVFLRYLVPDHPDHSPRARVFFERIMAGALSVFTIDSVILEVVFTLQRSYRLSKPAMPNG